MNSDKISLTRNSRRMHIVMLKGLFASTSFTGGAPELAEYHDLISSGLVA